MMKHDATVREIKISTCGTYPRRYTMLGRRVIIEYRTPRTRKCVNAIYFRIHGRASVAKAMTSMKNDDVYE